MSKNKELSLIPTVLIRKVQDQIPLTKEEIFALIKGFQDESVPAYQMSALLMAIYYKGITKQEKVWLTEALMKSGETLSWPDENYIDKHSTGGVGDKVSIILAPLLAAMGFKLPMMAGRGLGHTGGTIDKLESIGVNTGLSIDDFKKYTNENQFCIIGQTKDICPADKKLYALRDVTCTVSSLPLITASIVSKKIAEGVKGIVYDVKTGSGAFMKAKEDSITLAESLVETSKGLGAKSIAVITDMSQPLGRYVGNSLEMFECFEILDNKKLAYSDYKDTSLVTLELAARITALIKNVDYKKAYETAKTKLHDGSTKELLYKALKNQGWNGEIPKPQEKFHEFKASKSGYISSFDNEQIGWAGVALGAGRKNLQSIIDPHVGFYFNKKISSSVNEGECLVKVYYNDPDKLNDALKLLENSIMITETKTEEPKLIQDIIS